MCIQASNEVRGDNVPRRRVDVDVGDARGESVEGRRVGGGACVERNRARARGEHAALKTAPALNCAPSRIGQPSSPTSFGECSSSSFIMFLDNTMKPKAVNSDMILRLATPCMVVDNPA